MKYMYFKDVPTKFPSDDAGVLIGKGGATIKAIHAKFRAFV